MYLPQIQHLSKLAAAAVTGGNRVCASAILDVSRIFERSRGMYMYMCRCWREYRRVAAEYRFARRHSLVTKSSALDH